MAWLVANYQTLITFVVYLVANEVVLHNPNIISGSIPSMVWGALVSAVKGKTLPPPLP